MVEVIEKRAFGWFWFFSKKEVVFDKEKCGKWMYFFNNQEFAKTICKKAIEENACYECKCSDLELINSDKGVVCFYLDVDDIENHRRMITFMLENKLIQKTKTGKLYNISFKLDSQTRAREYGADFEGKIKLAEFVDLETGEWIKNRDD